MSKEEFLKTLRKKLNVLEDSEIEDIISEYEGYIEEKVAVGLTEEEAVKELGDIDEIVRDLLAAYKVKGEPTENWFNRFINKISKGIDNFMESLNDKSAKDIIKVLIEIIIVLILICILKIPFAMIRDLGSNIFSELVNPVGSIFNGIWRFIIEFSYIVVAIIFFFKMFEKRYFKGVSEKIVEDVEDTENTNKINSKNKKGLEKEETTQLEEKKEIKQKVKERPVDHPFIDALTKICILILKFFAVLFVIGAVCYLIGMSVALGFMIYLICKGVMYFGILILLIAMFMGGALVLELLIDFIFNKKIKAAHIFAKLITAIIILGIGLTFSAIEISNTEIIYENYHKTKSISKKIPVTSNLELYNYDKVIIDNSLTNEIKIEYVYPDFGNNIDIEIELEDCGRGYCLSSNIKEFKWNKNIIDTLINNLKDKKIYTYDFRMNKNIYLSEENYNKIIKNNNKEEYTTSTFTRTYAVLGVNGSNAEEYLYLTVRQYQEEEIETVRVLKSLNPTIEPNKPYEFNFTCSTPERDIKSLFNNCQVNTIKLTDKYGTAQIQEQ